MGSSHRSQHSPTQNIPSDISSVTSQYSRPHFGTWSLPCRIPKHPPVCKKSKKQWLSNRDPWVGIKGSMNILKLYAMFFFFLSFCKNDPQLSSAFIRIIDSSDIKLHCCKVYSSQVGVALWLSMENGKYAMLEKGKESIRGFVF